MTTVDAYSFPPPLPGSRRSSFRSRDSPSWSTARSVPTLPTAPRHFHVAFHLLEHFLPRELPVCARASNRRNRSKERAQFNAFFFIIAITIIIIIIIWERSFLLEHLTTKKGKKERKKGKKRGKSNKSTRSGVGVPDASVG